MFAVAHPDLVSLLSPRGKLVGRDQASIGAGAGIFRQRRLGDIFLQDRLDAIGRDHDVDVQRRAIRELQVCASLILLKCDTAVTCAYGGLRNRVGEHTQQVGPMRPIDPVPAVRVGCEDFADGRAVHPAVFGAVADLRAHLRHRLAKTHAFQLPQTIRIDHNAGADLAQHRRLFQYCDVGASSNERISGREATNASSNHGNPKAIDRHIRFQLSQWSSGRSGQLQVQSCPAGSRRARQHTEFLPYARVERGRPRSRDGVRPALARLLNP